MLIQLLNGEDYYFINYYNYATDRANGGYFFSKKIGEKIVRYQTGDDIIESTLEIEDMKNNGKEKARLVRVTQTSRAFRCKSAQSVFPLVPQKWQFVPPAAFRVKFVLKYEL